MRSAGRLIAREGYLALLFLAPLLVIGAVGAFADRSGVHCQGSDGLPAARHLEWVLLLLLGAVCALAFVGLWAFYQRRSVEARRLRELERARLTDRFRVLTLATSQMVWTTDAAGRVVEDSPSWQRVTGQTSDEQRGLGWLDAVHPDDREPTRRSWAESVAARKVYEGEYRVRLASGEYGWTAARAAPILDAGGAVVEWIGVNTDIRARKAAEEERQRLGERLEEARAQAEAANRAKDEFLAMLSHELRNPMAPIVTALDLMRWKGAAGVEREQQVIERQVGHMQRLIEDLLDIARITRGKLQLRKELVELGPLVQKAVEIVSPIFEERQHQLCVEVEEVRLVADPVRFSQVMANILTNAAKYTDPGGRIVLKARTEGTGGTRQLVVRVCDNGIGIAPDVLPRIFEPFHQGPRSLDRAAGGMGLGLALVRSLVELHGGTVSAASAGLGHGSELTVRVPVESGIVEAPITVEKSAPRSGRGRNILLVDDNVDAGELLAEVLRLHGHEVRVAHDGPDALRAAREQAPEVAVLDLGLPVMDGYELAERLRAQVSPPPPVIAVTGYGHERDRRRSEEAGFARHLVKPVDARELVRAIDELAPAERPTS